MSVREDINSAKYVFAGNRAFVLERMMKLRLDVVGVWAVKGSYLEKFLKEKNINYRVIENKEGLIEEIEKSEFNFFISNGLPIIIPISRVDRNGSRKFINIHPSLLPDLRGADPIPGALLYDRDTGATCHVMDDGIDTGDIIAQIQIPMTDDFDAGLLYQMSFRAEADVFEKAYENNFEAIEAQVKGEKDVYYSFNPDDLYMDIDEMSVKEIFCRVRAFSTRNKGAYIKIDGTVYVVEDIRIVNNSYVRSAFENSPESKILLSYEDKIVIRIKGELVLMRLRNAQ